VSDEIWSVCVRRGLNGQFPRRALLKGGEREEEVDKGSEGDVELLNDESLSKLITL
jgi:hypothetical protein